LQLCTFANSTVFLRHFLLDTKNILSIQNYKEHSCKAVVLAVICLIANIIWQSLLEMLYLSFYDIVIYIMMHRKYSENKLIYFTLALNSTTYINIINKENIIKHIICNTNVSFSFLCKYKDFTGEFWGVHHCILETPSTILFRYFWGFICLIFCSGVARPKW